MGAGAAGFHVQQLDISPGQEGVAAARGGGGVLFIGVPVVPVQLLAQLLGFSVYCCFVM
jgi:hypothetical protein